MVGGVVIISTHLLYALTVPSIYRASQSGNVKRLELMVERGVDVNTKKYGYTPLHIAAQNGRTRAVSSLIRAGASLDDLKDNWETPLHSAIRDGHVEVLNLLLRAGANPNIGPTPPLIWAIQRGQLGCAFALLENGADATVKDAQGIPALFYASLVEAAQLMDTLMQHSASLSQTTSDGKTLSEWLKAQGYTSAQAFLDSLKSNDD